MIRISPLFVLLVWVTPAYPQDNAAVESSSQEPTPQQIVESLDWIDGPAEVAITDRATLVLPEGYTYLAPEGTDKMMELMENPPSGNEYMVAPESLDWFALFSFEESGYVSDDEEIDADSLFESLKEGSEAGNAERRSRGWSEINLVGWQYPPAYESDTNRLAWALLAESEGYPIINYNTRLLGRRGVMSATLVSDPSTLDGDVEAFKKLLGDFSYNDGQRYAQFREGDKVAAYGLAALVAGGAAAAASKSGALKGLLKFLAVGALALWYGIKKFAGGLFGRKGGAGADS